MKLLLVATMGAALVAGCAPFEHGHYANDVVYQNNVGDPRGTPLVQHDGFFDGLASYVGLGGSDHAAHHTAQAQNFTRPSVTQASFVPVQTFQQPVQQSFINQPFQQTIAQPSFVSQPLQQQFIGQPIQQVAFQPAPQPIQQNFSVPQVQQISAQPVLQSIPQQVQQRPTPPKRFNAPTPIVSDIEVVPAAQSFFSRNDTFSQNQVPQSNVFATTLGSEVQFDADGYAICNIPGHVNAAHLASQFQQQPRPRF